MRAQENQTVGWFHFWSDPSLAWQSCTVYSYPPGRLWFVVTQGRMSSLFIFFIFLRCLHRFLLASLLFHCYSLLFLYFVISISISDAFEPASLINYCQNCFTWQSLILSMYFINHERGCSSSLAKVVFAGKSAFESVKSCCCRASASLLVTWNLSCPSAGIPPSAGLLSADPHKITGSREGWGSCTGEEERGKGQTEGLAQVHAQSLCQSGKLDSSCSTPSFLN